MIVQCADVGRIGRFGNSLFQYAYANAYAKAIGATLQTYQWVGQEIFEIDDPPIEKELSPLSYNSTTWGVGNVRLTGFFQGHEHVSRYTQAWAKTVFKLRPKYQAMWHEDDPKVVAHVRYGDYGHNIGKYCLIGREAYLRAFDEWNVREIVDWVSDDDTARDTWFKPWRSRHHDSTDPIMSFLPDFLHMMRAKTLFRANSTFSFWAGLLNPHGRIYSPLVEDKVGCRDDIPFVIGNWPKMCSEFSNVYD